MAAKRRTVTCPGCGNRISDGELHCPLCRAAQLRPEAADLPRLTRTEIQKEIDRENFFLSGVRSVLCGFLLGCLAGAVVVVVARHVLPLPPAGRYDNLDLNYLTNSTHRGEVIFYLGCVGLVIGAVVGAVRVVLHNRASRKKTRADAGTR
jgi:hypothetical protein